MADVPAVVQQKARHLAAHRAQLLASGWLTLTELAARRGDPDVAASGASAAVPEHAQELIVVTGPNDMLVVPTFQLTPAGTPRPELRAVLAALSGGGVGSWQSWTWLTSPSSYLSGAVPERMVATDPGRVARAAARFAAAERSANPN